MKCNKDDNMFKPGDKVFVRHHTQDEKEIYPLVWVHGTNRFEGKLCEIDQVFPDLCYTVKNGSFRYNFVASSLMENVNSNYEQF